MRRTAADFAREAVEPYEIEVGTGKSKRGIAPKPYSDITRPVQMELARINDAWAEAAGSVPAVPPMAIPHSVDDDGRTVRDGVPEMSPDVFVLRWRFDGLEARQPTPDDPRAFVPKQTARDYDAFYQDWYVKLPTRQWSQAMDECDRHYDPTPGTPEERAAGIAGQFLEQCQELLRGAGDDQLAKDLLAQIDTVLGEASPAAGKSRPADGA